MTRRHVRRRNPNPGGGRALELLAAAGPDGLTEAMMMTHGFTVRTMVMLVRAGLASVTVDRDRQGKMRMEIARVHITTAGRRVLAEKRR